MDRRLAIVAAIALAIVIATGNFFFFHITPEYSFVFHNAASLALGIALVAIAYILLTRGSGTRFLQFTIMLAGLWMAMAHVVKLAVGHCI